MKDHVVATKIAVNDAGFIAFGDRGGQPCHQRVHVGIAARQFVLEVLLRPAPDLARKIVAGTTVVAKADRLMINAVQRRDRGIHRIIVSRALVFGDLGKARIPEDAAFDHVHDVERAADDAFVLANTEYPGHGHRRWSQRAQHARLAQHIVCAFQQRPRWLAPHDIARAGRGQAVRRVGLPALELFNGQRACKSGNIGFHPSRQCRLVEGHADFARASILIHVSRHGRSSSRA